MSTHAPDFASSTSSTKSRSAIRTSPGVGLVAFYMPKTNPDPSVRLSFDDANSDDDWAHLFSTNTTSSQTSWSSLTQNPGFVRLVTGKVVDAFRAPTTPYGPGNRGWEYETDFNTPVLVVAPGTVVFAGQVGGVLNVVVRHPDGTLTTYSKLWNIEVAAGEALTDGAVVGHSGDHFYFGARRNGQYIDPELLFSVRARLVPTNPAVWGGM